MPFGATFECVQLYELEFNELSHCMDVYTQVDCRALCGVDWLDSFETK